jgi:hypothetical protein
VNGLPKTTANSPEMELLGPGSVGEGSLALSNSTVKTEDLLKETGPVPATLSVGEIRSASGPR